MVNSLISETSRTHNFLTWAGIIISSRQSLPSFLCLPHRLRTSHGQLALRCCGKHGRVGHVRQGLDALFRDDLGLERSKLVLDFLLVLDGEAAGEEVGDFLLVGVSIYIGTGCWM